MYTVYDIIARMKSVQTHTRDAYLPIREFPTYNNNSNIILYKRRVDRFLLIAYRLYNIFFFCSAVNNLFVIIIKGIMRYTIILCGL